MQFDLLDSAHNAILSTDTYSSFKEALQNSNCRRCSLCEKRDKIVIDRGNPKARVMIISERPGENENREGLAFVGKAGALLDKIFAAIGMDTDRDIIITNVVKCMPPIDRSPTTAEVNACLPYLHRQIELVKPKVIVLLGAVALKFVSGENGEIEMEKFAGRFMSLPSYPGIQFMVLYHPAFLLRDPRKKKDMWEHVQKLRDYLKGSAEIR
jgi:DNA polymerase